MPGRAGPVFMQARRELFEPVPVQIDSVRQDRVGSVQSPSPSQKAISMYIFYKYLYFVYLVNLSLIVSVYCILKYGLSVELVLTLST